ncbi:MAG: tyrosine-type recombinase/integrase [Hyphomicrobiaceae bacterium]
MPVWGKFPVSSIDKSMIMALRNKVRDRDGPSAANHAFSGIRKLFNWCIEREYLQSSPCHRLMKPAKHVERERVLNDDELRAAWRGREQMSYPSGPYVQLLILTAQRRDEVANLQWSDLDWNDRTWWQPKSKTNRPQRIPLSPAARSGSKTTTMKVKYSQEHLTKKPFAWPRARNVGGTPNRSILNEPMERSTHSPQMPGSEHDRQMANAQN